MGILLATLTPIPGAAERSALTPVLCLVCGEVGAVDVLNNLFLFLPLGFALRLAGMRTVAAVALAALTTISVEAAQYWIVPGRDASLSDVLTNTTGGAAGVLLANALPSLLRPSGRTLTLLLSLAGAIPTGILAASAWLLRPAPPHSSWFGQWAPDLGQYERFRGRILTASLGGRFMPGGALRASDKLPLELRATFVSGPLPPDLAPIVSVFDQHQRKVILLGQNDRDLHFEARTRGENYRFRPLALALAGALPAEPGDTLNAMGRYDGRALHLEVSGTAATRERSLNISAALGWALIAPWEGPLGSQTRSLTALWLLLLWTPLGFYFRRAVQSQKRHALLAGIAGGAMLITTANTLLAGFPLNHWSEWVGAALGVSVGYGVNRALD
ncbi:MAG TPA: VanZ family protein [Gemmatimonadales bacterium]|nr:VanZ family protein [Gemmatimonadales bacterium]